MAGKLTDILEELLTEKGDIETSNYSFIVDPEQDAIYVVEYNITKNGAQTMVNGLAKFKLNITMEQVPLDM